MHGLNLYDYAARYYDPADIRFTTMDPHSENDYSWSPYVYVGNNPMKFIDLDGRDPVISLGSKVYRIYRMIIGVNRVGKAARMNSVVAFRTVINENQMLNSPILEVFELNKTDSEYREETLNALIGGITIDKSERIKDAKKSKKSDKERATDFPDWIDKEYTREEGESIDNFLTDVMNDRFGEGKWKKGPGSEYNKYRKNFFRDDKDKKAGIIIVKGLDTDTPDRKPIKIKDDKKEEYK